MTRAIRILAEGKVRLTDLMTHRLPLDDWQKAFTACEDKSALKALSIP